MNPDWGDSRTLWGVGWGVAADVDVDRAAQAQPPQRSSAQVEGAFEPEKPKGEARPTLRDSVVTLEEENAAKDGASSSLRSTPSAAALISDSVSRCRWRRGLYVRCSGRLTTELGRRPTASLLASAQIARAAEFWTYCA
jgi:hypothetical protein